MLYTFAFVGMLTVNVALHLFAIVSGKEIIRRITKVLLMPLLAVSFYLMWRTFSPNPLPWQVVAALLLGCAGDAFLINHHNRIGFPLGLVAFSIGHVFYIIQLFSLISAPAWWIILLLVVLYGTGVVVTFKMLSPYLPKQFRVGCVFYMMLLCLLSAAAVIGLLTRFSLGSVIVTIGTLLFLLSDTKLSFEIFKGDSKNGNLIVMITYIAAQLLLATGFFLWMA